MTTKRQKYIAFLRAINVGGHVVKMDRLRALFEGSGFQEVETFIASGNVIFESSSNSIAPLEKKIEKLLQQALGYSVSTFLRTPIELESIVELNPFVEQKTEGTATIIGFLHADPSPAARVEVSRLATDVDDLRLLGREVYWYAGGGIGTSKIAGGALEKALGMPTTMRNMTTVRKLAAKYARR